MQLAVCLLLIGTAVVADNVGFRQKRIYDDLDLFENFAIGPPTTCSRVNECGQRCVKNLDCSMFSFNQDVETCQIYTDVLYADLSSTNLRPGERYFAFAKGWCPLKRGFFLFRSVNMCLKLPSNMRTYDNGLERCGELGARMIVLEDEDKATAVMQSLARLGLDFAEFFVGVHQRVSPGTFVWEDGRRMVRQWWGPGEPNGDVVSPSDPESCVFLHGGALYDYICSQPMRFICEKPQQIVP